MNNRRRRAAKFRRAQARTQQQRNARITHLERQGYQVIREEEMQAMLRSYVAYRRLTQNETSERR